MLEGLKTRENERGFRNRIKFSLIRTAKDDSEFKSLRALIWSYYRWLLKMNLSLIKLLFLNFLWYGTCSLIEQKIKKTIKRNSIHEPKSHNLFLQVYTH